MYQHLRPWLFKVDPERVHDWTLRLVRLAGQLPPVRGLLRALYEVNDPQLEVSAFGLRFKNPIGLAAGYDKNGVAVAGLSALGFGHIEIGTVTRRPQIGNPQPRLHRVSDAALINSMGFPNVGARALKIDRAGSECRVGVNIGKGKDTPLDQAAEEYAALFEEVQPLADYVTINVSSPNTLQIRRLQARDYLDGLLSQVARRRDALAPRKPVLVKIAPDLSEAEIDDVLAAIDLAGIDGLIATNTTLGRGGVPDRCRELKGGLSGSPLSARSTEVIRYVARRTQGRLPIIGVGGVMDAAGAIEKLEAGATLIQLYTGLVYAGPSLVKDINRALTQAVLTRVRPAPATTKEPGFQAVSRVI